MGEVCVRLFKTCFSCWLASRLPDSKNTPLSPPPIPVRVNVRTLPTVESEIYAKLKPPRPSPLALRPAVCPAVVPYVAASVIRPAPPRPPPGPSRRPVPIFSSTRGQSDKYERGTLSRGSRSGGSVRSERVERRSAASVRIAALREIEAKCGGVVCGRWKGAGRRED